MIDYLEKYDLKKTLMTKTLMTHKYNIIILYTYFGGEKKGWILDRYKKKML
jgi:hypothetical protein